MNQELKEHMQEVWDEVSQIIENRYVFNRLREVLNSNLEIVANVFFDHYVVNYASSISVSVRRQVDKKTTRGGLRAVLDKLLVDPTLAKKEDYIKSVETHASCARAEKLWKRDFGRLDYIDPKILKADIEELELATSKAKDFVDKNIAHRDKDGKLFSLSYGELDNAVNTLERLTIKYNSLLVNPGAYANTLLAGNIQGWERILTKPWVTEIPPDTQFPH